MVRYIIARHIGDSDAYYQRKQTYPLAVKIRFFSRKVECYKRRGYHDDMEPGTHRVFANMESFEKVFKEIREDRR